MKSLLYFIIVVTHDVRAAYEFADRIIMLNKGKKTEDLIKKHHDDTNEIKVEQERRLKNMFSENPSEEILPSQKQAHFEKAGRMPLSSAFFIAFAQLKRKISYTVLSIIIFAIILGGLGIVRTCASFDGVSSFANLIKRGDFRTVGLATGEINEYNDIIYEGKAFSYDDYVSLKNKYGNAYKVYNFSYSIERYVYDIKDINNNKKKFTNIQGICELDGEMGEKELEMFYGAKLVLGSYPKTSEDAVEILISDTLADDILSAGAYFEDEIVYPSGTYDSIIGKSLIYESVKFKIVGIYTHRYTDVAASDKTGIVYDKLRFFSWQYVSPVAITNGGAIERQIKKYDAFSGVLNVVDDNVEIPRQISTAFIPVNNMTGVESLAEEYEVP